MQEIGEVVEVWRYPVKGMRGEKLESGVLAPHGIQSDRRFMVACPAKEVEGKKPRVTARDEGGEQLLLYTPVWEPGGLHVKARNGTRYPISDPRLAEHLSQLLGLDVAIRYSETGNYDLRDVSLLSTQTVEQFEREWGHPLDFRRFRPNLLVRWHDEGPFFEPSLVGRTLQIGDGAKVIGVQGELRKKPCDGIGRCKVITYDPVTLDHDPTLLGVVGKHGAIAGVYASVADSGPLRPKQKIYVLD